MKFRDRAKLLIKNGAFEEYVRSFLNGDPLPGTMEYDEISAQTAMKYSAVFACCRVLSETVASMPIMEYKKLPDGSREATRDTEAFDLLHRQPNAEMTPFSFKEACMMDLNLGGNAVCERQNNKLNELVGLYPYRWQAVEITRSPETGEIIYKIRGKTEQRELKRDQVFHIPGLSLDGIVGISPIQYASNAIRLGINYEQFGNEFYKNGVNPSGAITFQNEMKETAFIRFKEDFNKNFAGMRNTGKPIILENGGVFKPFAINPIDAQLIENKRFQINDVARIYRVPPHMVGDLERATFSNIEHQSLEFVMYTMLPWCKRIEEAANMQLLNKKQSIAGYYLEFNMSSLLRGDQKSRADAYAVGRQWGWLSVNDIRRLENMPPIQNGDIYLSPLNMGDAGKTEQADKTQAMAKQIVEMLKAR